MKILLSEKEEIIVFTKEKQKKKFKLRRKRGLPCAFESTTVFGPNKSVPLKTEQVER